MAMASMVLSSPFPYRIRSSRPPCRRTCMHSIFKSRYISNATGIIFQVGMPSQGRPISGTIALNSNVGMPSVPFSRQYRHNSMAVSASSSSSTSTSSSSSSSSYNVEYLEKEFGGKGIKFASIAGMCVLEMTVENGSSARLVLPSGLITSYKPLMWHDGFVEMLHTIVSENSDGEPTSIQGGIALVLNNLGHDAGDGFSWSATDWVLENVLADPKEAVQVTLRCSNGDGMLSVKYVVTLYAALLTTAVLVDNISTLSIKLVGSVMSHLTLSTPEAAYAIGLKGCSYCQQPPLLSRFSIISQIPTESKPFSAWSALQQFFGMERKGNEYNTEPEEIVTGETSMEPTWTVEAEDHASLRNKMSRVYSTPPSKFRVIDRGKRHLLILRRVGFEEFYIYSPGSTSNFYEKDCFICTGPASVLQPVVLTPGGKWRAAQMLQNPNV